MKKYMKLKLSFLIFLTIIFTGCNENSTDPDEFGSSNGHVYQINTNVPISGVIVSIDGISYTTKSDGEFIIESIPVGRKTIKAQKSDYELYQQTITIEKNKTTSVDIYMTNSISGTTLSGVVLDKESQSPISGVKITLAQQVDYTDSEGKYQLTNVPQGTHEILAEKDKYIIFSSQVFLSSDNKVFNIELLKGTEILDGNIKENTTYYYENSPYYIRDNVVIDKGKTLTIEAGVVLKFDSGFKLTENYNENNDQRDDQGYLQATGNHSLPIIFTSSSNTPSPSSWNGLELVNRNNNISYFIIEYADIGLKVLPYKESSYSGDFLPIVLLNCEIQYCNIGIQGPLDLTNGYISQNNIGINTIKYGQDINIENVTLIDNYSNAIELSGTESCNFVLNYCTLKNNGGDGIYQDDGRGFSWYPYEAQSIVRNSVFENNIGNGIVFKGDRLNISNSNFIDNQKYAFSAKSWSQYQYPTYIENNYIEANNGKGDIDTTLDGSGGQYTSYSVVYSKYMNIKSYSEIKNSNAGSDWGGF